MSKPHPAWDPNKCLHGERDVQWGEFHRKDWYAPGGVEHPLSKQIITEIQNNKHLFEGRQVWIGGGLLQPWYSWDIDLFIEGEWSEGAKQMLEWCAGLGFYYGVFIDVKLVTKYADVRLWQDTRDIVKFKSYIHSPEIYIEGKQSEGALMYVPYKDVYVVDSQIPVDKNLQKDSEEFLYNYGIRILI
jgi:hypothetical protein